MAAQFRLAIPAVAAFSCGPGFGTGKVCRTAMSFTLERIAFNFRVVCPLTGGQ